VPLAIGIALTVVALLYLALQASAQGVLGAALADDPTIHAAPLTAVATRLFGPIGKTVLTVGALVSTTGYVLGDVLAGPRVLYALAADGHLPRILARIHPRYETPVPAIVLHGVTGALLAASGTFATLIVLTNVAILVLYLLCCIAALVVLYRNRPRAGSTATAAAPAAGFNLPFGPTVPVLASAVVLWLLAHAALREYAAVAATIVVATLAYTFKPRRSSSPTPQGSGAP
jgi:amino acid transporter